MFFVATLLAAKNRGVKPKFSDNVIGRLIEVKHEMVNHDLKMFQFHDDIFADLKMTPADFVLQVQGSAIDPTIPGISGILSGI